MSVVEVRSTAKKWEVFPGKNKFCCNGRLMMGNQPSIFYVTLFLIIIVTGLFFGSDCPYLAVHLSPAIPVAGILLFLFVISFLLHTSCTDPGIIPRATKEEAADLEKQIEVQGAACGRDLTLRTRELTINGVLFKLKYCQTCKIFRPPRASHCSICDNCVERFDHHCPWVGNCIGKRNYRYFYLFLISVSMHCIFICAFSVTTLVLISIENENGFVAALQTSPGSIVEAVIAFFSLWSVIGLAGFHTYLVSCNMTTNEDIKKSSSKPGQGNPFSRGSLCNNYCEVICGPTPPSLIIDRQGSVVLDENSQTQPRPVTNGCSTDSLIAPAVHQTELLTLSEEKT